jgi:uncharacterized protein (TIGR02466 family)
MKLEFNEQRNLTEAFCTPIARFSVPNAESLNAILEPAILKREHESSGIKKTNVGGWQSMGELLDWPEVAATDFRETLLSAVSHMIGRVSGRRQFRFQAKIKAWANVNRGGSFNRIHNHPDCHWSGAYYVRPGQPGQDEPKRAGCIEFHDPRGAVNMVTHPGRSGFGTPCFYRPEAGTLFVFPSWLMHSVNPISAETCRISIAFNALIERYMDKGDK